MDKKMEQESGENSQNIQIAGNVTIGISASEARQIAIDVFKANFYEFSENAAQKALNRAEEITDDFIEKFYNNFSHLEEKLQEPGVQSTIFNIQKEYAKTGDKDLKNQLLDLLIQRIDSEERSLKQIVLDEAIKIIPKLTHSQINILTLTFSAIHFNHQNIVSLPSLINFLNNKLLCFYTKESKSYSFFTHLQFTGCCTILPEGSSYKPYDQIIISRYKALFIKGFTEQDFKNEFTDDIIKLRPLIMRSIQNPNTLQFNPLNDEVFKERITQHNLGSIGNKAIEFQDKFMMSDNEIIDFLESKNSLFRNFSTDWKENDLKTIRPTSVGFAIAILNYNRVTGEDVPLEHFI